MSFFAKQDENEAPEQARASKSCASAQRTTYDWRTQDLTQAAAAITGSSVSKQPERRGYTGKQPPRATLTSANVFCGGEPRPEPQLNSSIIEKIEQGQPLTADERSVALYHPQLFRPAPKSNNNLAHAATLTRDGQVVRPWQVGGMPAEFKSSRKLKVQPSEQAPPQTDAEELFADSGRKKHGFFSVQQETPAAGGKPLPLNGGRKHIEPPVSGTQEFLSSPRKKVAGGGQATVNLKVDEPETAKKMPAENPQHFAKKRVDVPFQDTFHITHPERVGVEVHHETGRKKLTPASALETYKQTQRKATPQVNRCPFGTENSYEVIKSRRAGTELRPPGSTKELLRDMSSLPSPPRVAVPPSVGVVPQGQGSSNTPPRHGEGRMMFQGTSTHSGSKGLLSWE